MSFIWDFEDKLHVIVGKQKITIYYKEEGIYVVRTLDISIFILQYHSFAQQAQICIIWLPDIISIKYRMQFYEAKFTRTPNLH